MPAFALTLLILAGFSALVVRAWMRRWEAALRRTVLPLRTDER